MEAAEAENAAICERVSGLVAEISSLETEHAALDGKIRALANDYAALQQEVHIMPRQLSDARSGGLSSGGRTKAECANGARPRDDTIAQPDLIGHVFLFAGKSEHLFLGGVCRSWRAASLIAASDPVYRTKTSLESAVVSVARIEWAMDSGLEWDETVKMTAAGSADGLAVLQWAFDSGRLDPDDEQEQSSHGAAAGLCLWAAYHGRLETLKWLRAKSFRWTSLV